MLLRPMPKVHSHYENLKVARDAPPDAIRAAYRALTRKHHPDRRPGDADAQRVMSVINVAYAVLSDPVKRREHDHWLEHAEAPAARPLRSRHTLHAPVPAPPRPRGSAMQPTTATGPQVSPDGWQRLRAQLLQYRTAWALGGLVLVLALVLGAQALFEPGIGLRLANVGAAAAARPADYTRPPTAPNGQPWPAGSGTVAGYEQIQRGGLAEITLDNTRNHADMFAKVVALDGVSAFPVRTVFVAAGGRLRITGLGIGTYDLRYRNLVNGLLQRSPAFILEEVATPTGPRHSAPTLPLYEAGSGTLHTYALTDAEFF